MKYIFGYLGTSSFSESSQGLSQYSIIQNALSSGKYGLIGEDGQLILLKRSYTYPPRFFSHGENIVIPQNEMISLNHPNDNNGTINNTDNSLFYNNNFYLLPGKYQLGFLITPNSDNLSASLNFQIYGHFAGKDNLNNTVNIVKGETNISFEFSVNNVYLLRYLSVTATRINGQMRLDLISIKQLN